MTVTEPIIEVDRVMRSDPDRVRLPHDESFSAGAAYANGKYVPLVDAVIPILDMGFLQCDAVYEKATLAKGRLFRLQDHFGRFSRSCDKFSLRNPLSEVEMLNCLTTLVRLTGLMDAGVFWCLTRGLAKHVSDRNNQDAFESRFYAIVDGYGSIVTDQQRIAGITLLISKNYIRIPPAAVDPTAKNFHWQDMKLSLFEARRAGMDWSVLCDADGYLTEAPGANIFVVKDGTLLTPDAGCLEGITRKTVLELAEMLDVRTNVSRVHSSELLSADEAFLTSSAGGVMPVRSVDGVELGRNRGPGKLTVAIHNLYWQKLWSGWYGTPVDYSEAAYS